MKKASPLTHLIIKGAREHNLKNVNLTLPKNKLVVFTGLSGSGKSSMAHDTIYAEGQRRYVESLSSYARQFLGVMDKPDIDQIEGLSPAIMIDQKQGSQNPRSTVGTVTEIYDYLRLLYARIGHPHCHQCGLVVKPQDITQIVSSTVDLCVAHPEYTKKKGTRIMILSPIAKNKKGEFKELFSNLHKKGILECRVDGQILKTNTTQTLFKNNRHNIEAVLDKLVIGSVQSKPEYEKQRLTESIERALDISSGEVIVSIVTDPSFSFPDNPKQLEDHLFSQNLSCPKCNISLEELQPRQFSFNSPDGACPTCTGLGTKLALNQKAIIAPELTLHEGAIIPLASQFEHRGWMAKLIVQAMDSIGFDANTPLKKLSEKERKILFEGTGKIKYGIKGGPKHSNRTWQSTFRGLIKIFEKRYQETSSEHVRSSLEPFMIKKECSACQGNRLKKESLSVTINGMSIAEISKLPIDQLLISIKQITETLTKNEKAISKPILKETRDRLTFLSSVGLDYLSLSRESGSLSGGELQRIRLASQIGSRLTGILYILDEPTIGLHQQDNQKLINTLRGLSSIGNTLIVVEHDRNTIESANHIVEFGPQAGEHGGKITFQGTVDEIKDSSCITGQYLSGKRTIKLPKTSSRRLLTDEQVTSTKIILSNCTHHNLKDISVDFPLNKLVAVTGVSGSGKSSLVVDTLNEALSRKLNSRHHQRDIPFEGIDIPDNVNKVSLITQNPIGRTPRSNPATYTKIFDYVRQAFAGTKEANFRGYGPGRFSFNVKGGRCETCQGDGQIKIEMQFMGDLYITCETCLGSRYNQPTLEIEYKDKNIAEVLDMTIDQAYDFFRPIPIIEKKLKTLQEVGLGYIKLGQPAPTLSGGEAQRVKLSAELAKTNLGHTIYILDEPTTGLHFHDLNKLLKTLKKLVDKDNTVIIIEHNLDIIKNADHIIDLGPKGGDKGGEIIAEGAPKHLAKNFTTPTAQELKKLHETKT
jgi:excinuclease ABC subunit A